MSKTNASYPNPPTTGHVPHVADPGNKADGDPRKPPKKPKMAHHYKPPKRRATRSKSKTR